MFYRLSRAIVYSIFRVFFKIEIEGKDKIPLNKPFLLASNHLSNLDPPLLAACCPSKIGFLAKKELFKDKLFGACIKALGAIPLNRERAGIGIMRLCLKTLLTKSLLIFPQGTRGGSLDDPFSGVGFLCKKAKVSVVAARIHRTDKTRSKRLKFPLRGKIKVIFTLVDDIEDADSYEEITLKVVNKIKSL